MNEKSNEAALKYFILEHSCFCNPGLRIFDDIWCNEINLAAVSGSNRRQHAAEQLSPLSLGVMSLIVLDSRLPCIPISGLLKHLLKDRQQLYCLITTIAKLRHLRDLIRLLYVGISDLRNSMGSYS
jgi:hypothetical protein